MRGLLVKIVALAFTALVPAIDAAATSKLNAHRELHHPALTVVDTSHHGAYHVQMLETDRVSSLSIHHVSIPRSSAKGMWIPSDTIENILQRHRNSITNKVQEQAKTSFGQNAILDPVGKPKLHQYVNLPDSFSGTKNEPLHILQQHGIDVKPLIADELMYESRPVSHLVERDFAVLEPRVNPFVLKLGIAAGGFIAEGLFSLSCQVASQSLNFTTTGKVACFAGAFLLSSLGTFGAGYTAARYALGNSASDAGRFASEVFTSGLTSIVGILNGATRRRRGFQPWYAGHLHQLSALYNDSLILDDELSSKGHIHLDADNGQPLTTWDVLMSHFYPIRHSFHSNLSSTIWHESKDGNSRQHRFMSLLDSSPRLTIAGHQIDFAASSRIDKRQCAQSDTERTFNEAPSENWCEQGSSAGPVGVYNGYHFTGTTDQADSMHLRFGNDTYALQVARLEGQLAFLTGRNSVCENVTSNGQQIMLGLREIERQGDQYIGFGGC